MRQSTTENSTDLTDVEAQSYVLEGPRVFPKLAHIWNNPDVSGELGWTTGNLDWERFDELKFLHGTAIIAQFYSEKAKHSGENFDEYRSVDAHELGHILMNDAGHRASYQNIMGSDEHRSRLDQDQCELIYAYHASEKKRFDAIQTGMGRLCKVVSKLGYKPPSYCTK